MSDSFYPFVENETSDENTHLDPENVEYAARIAVYDDQAAAPRVVVVQPKPVREYLEEITQTVDRLAKEQGGKIPFTVIREVVENFIHAYFIEPTISILDNGNTIRFSDQGPGIQQKERALEYGTSSATETMRKYIRGVGSGLPYAQQYLVDKGGSLSIDDNISQGTVITISLPTDTSPQSSVAAQTQQIQMSQAQMQPQQPMQNYMPVPQISQQTPQYIPAQQPVFVNQQPMTQTQNTAFGIFIDVEEQKVMAYLAQHGSVGPSDLVHMFGSSAATWTRRLQSLEEKGLIKKNGQKRYLTHIGQNYLQSQM